MTALRIFKYPLVITDEQTFEVPGRFEPLSVHEQDGTLTMWAEVDPDVPPMLTKVWIAGTGHPLPDQLAPFVGTVPMSDGLVWHVFCAPIGTF